MSALIFFFFCLLFSLGNQWNVNPADVKQEGSVAYSDPCSCFDNSLELNILNFGWQRCGHSKISIHSARQLATGSCKKIQCWMHDLLCKGESEKKGRPLHVKSLWRRSKGDVRRQQVKRGFILAFHEMMLNIGNWPDTSKSRPYGTLDGFKTSSINHSEVSSLPTSDHAAATNRGKRWRKIDHAWKKHAFFFKVLLLCWNLGPINLVSCVLPSHRSSINVVVSRDAKAVHRPELSLLLPLMLFEIDFF